jgi:hypothetical protein
MSSGIAGSNAHSMPSSKISFYSVLLRQLQDDEILGENIVGSSPLVSSVV